MSCLTSTDAHNVEKAGTPSTHVWIPCKVIPRRLGMLHHYGHGLLATLHTFDIHTFSFTVVNNWMSVFNRMGFGASPAALR